MIVLLDRIGFPVFTFDMVENSGRSDPYDWTEFPIETGAIVSEFGFKRPFALTVGGKITATQLAIPGVSLDRLSDIYNSLLSLADEKQLVTVVDRNERTPNVAISNVRKEHNQAGGEAYSIKVDLKQITRLELSQTKIPPARYKPKVRKGASGVKKGGNTSGADPNAKTAKKSSLLLKVLRTAGALK